MAAFASGLDWTFDITWELDKGHEIWYMEWKEPVWVGFTLNSSQGICKA